MSQLNVREATITQKSGFVYVEREGERVTLEVGDAIYESDLIVTGADTTAEVQYLDGTTSRLAPNTQMRLVDFEFDANMNGENSFLVDIAAGAMRTVTGEIVKLNPDAFEIATPRATVGIRGTDIATQINSDGSETHLVISIGKGHRVEITTHDGQLFSLQSPSEGVFIPVLGGEIKPYIFNFTQEEVNDIIDRIQNALKEEHALENENNNETAHAAVIIDQSTVDILGSEVIETLTNTLESSGLEVVLPENLVLETEDEDVTLIPGELDEGPIIDALGFRVVSSNGQSDYYADAFADNLSAGQSYETTKTRINITNTINKDITISGDVGQVSAGTVQAANDIITGSDMEDGTIVGDASMVLAGAELIAGDDEVTFETKTGGRSIYGDAEFINAHAEVTFGNDIIIVEGVFGNSTIGGDANTVDASAIVHKWGDDIISVGSIKSTNDSAKIYGDASNSTNVGGNDSITVIGSMSDGEIYAGGGDDTVTIGEVIGGMVYTAYGNDIVNLQSFSATGTLEIVNEEGNDSVYLANGIGDGQSLYLGGAGNIELLKNENGDYIDITQNGELYLSSAQEIYINDFKGKITGSANNDTINITNTPAGTINTGDGADSITLVSIDTSLTIDGGGGSDTLTLTESGTHYLTKVSGVEVFNFSNSSDTIYVDNVSSSMSLNTGSGLDRVFVERGGTHDIDMTGDRYLFSTASDTINITSTGSSSSIFVSTGEGADRVNIDYNNSSGEIELYNHSNYGETLDTISIENFNSGYSYKSLKLEGIGGFKVIGYETDLLQLDLYSTSIEIDVAKDAYIRGKEGNNNVIIKEINFNDGYNTRYIELGDGNDDINIGTIFGDKETYFDIETFGGDDSIVINKMFGAHIYSGDGDDVIKIASNSGSTFEEHHGGGRIEGGVGDDYIQIGMLGGNRGTGRVISGDASFETETGADTIVINHVFVAANDSLGGDVKYDLTVYLGNGNDDTDKDSFTIEKAALGAGGTLDLTIYDYDKNYDTVTIFGQTLESDKTLTNGGLTITVDFA